MRLLRVAIYNFECVFSTTQCYLIEFCFCTNSTMLSCLLCNTKLDVSRRVELFLEDLANEID